MVSATLERETAPFMPTMFQSGIILDDRRFVVGIAGRGSGKSTAVVMRFLYMMHHNMIPAGARILVFGPNYPQMRMGTIKTFDKWFDQSGFTLKKIDGNEPERRCVNDITFYFRNASNPEQTRSHEPCLVWLDEAGQMTESVLTLTNASLRQFGKDFNYQTFISSTPRGRNWLYRRFEKFMHNEDAMVGFYKTTTVEAQQQGVDLPEGYVENMGYAPGTEMYRQEIEAEFVSWAGLVFNQNWRTPSPFILPQFVRVAGGIDFGLIAPSVIKLIGEAKDGSVWDFKEFYQPRARFEDLLATAVRFQRSVQESGAHFLGFACDAANPELIATLNHGGARSVKSIKKPDLATSYINSWMDRKMYFLSPDCHFTRMEMAGYQYKEMLSGDETAFTDKVKPNQPDHAINANQYAALRLGTARNHAQSGTWADGSFG